MSSAPPKKTASKSTTFVVAEQDRCRKWWTEEEVEFLSRDDILPGFRLFASSESAMLEQPVWTIFEETGNAGDKVLVSAVRFKHTTPEGEDNEASKYYREPPSSFSSKDTALGRVLLAPLPPPPKISSKRNTKRLSTKHTDYRIPIPDGNFDKAERAISAQISMLSFYRHIQPSSGIISVDPIALSLTKEAFCTALQIPLETSAALEDIVHDFQVQVQGALVALGLLHLKRCDGRLDSSSQKAIRIFQQDFNQKSEAMRATILAPYFKNTQAAKDELNDTVLRTEGLLDFKTTSALFAYVSELRTNLEMLGFATPHDPVKTPKKIKPILKSIREALESPNQPEAPESDHPQRTLAEIPKFVDDIAHAYRQQTEENKALPAQMRELVERVRASALTLKPPKDKRRSRRHSDAGESPGATRMTFAITSNAIDIKKPAQLDAGVSSGSAGKDTDVAIGNHGSNGAVHALSAVGSPPNSGKLLRTRNPAANHSPASGGAQPNMVSGSPSAVGTISDSIYSNSADTPKKASSSPHIMRGVFQIPIVEVAAITPPAIPSPKGSTTKPDTSNTILSPRSASASKNLNLHAPLPHSHSASPAASNAGLPPILEPLPTDRIIFDCEYHLTMNDWAQDVVIVDRTVPLIGYRLYLDPKLLLDRTRPAYVLVKGAPNDVVTGMSIRLISHSLHGSALWDYYTRAQDNRDFNLVSSEHGLVAVDQLDDAQLASAGLIKCPGESLHPYINRLRILATLQRLSCQAKDFEFNFTGDNFRSQDQLYLKYKVDRSVPIEDAIAFVVRNIQACLVALDYLHLNQMSPWYSNYLSEAVLRFEADYEHVTADSGKKFPSAGGAMTPALYEELMNQTNLFQQALLDLGYNVQCSPFEDPVQFYTYTAAYHEAQQQHQQAEAPAANPSPTFSPLMARKALATVTNSLSSPSVTSNHTKSKEGSTAVASATASPNTGSPFVNRFGVVALHQDAENLSTVLNQEIEFGSSLASKYKETMDQYEELQDQYAKLEESFLELANDAAEVNTSLQYFEEQYKESVQNYDQLVREYESTKRIAADNEDAMHALVQQVASLEAKLQKLQRIAQRSAPVQILWYLILTVLYILLLPGLGVCFCTDLYKSKVKNLPVTEENSLLVRLQRYGRHQSGKLERVIDDLERQVNKFTGLENKEKTA